MKTSLAAIAVSAAALASTPVSSMDVEITEQARISAFEPEDFALSLGGPEPDELVDGVEIRAANLGTMPALAGQGISMAVVNLDPCAINLPHVHPRASEMLYVIEGGVRSAFVEENGGNGAVVNDLEQGDVTVFPQGLIHYQQNLGCEPAVLLAALSSADPGVVTIATRFFELPTEVVQGVLNLEDAQLQALIDGLPEAPGEARLQCLEACGMLALGDDDEDVEFSYAYDSGADRKRNLRF